MTPQHRSNKIAELEQWLRDNPNHDNRTVIETDLRKIKEQEDSWPVERDTFDLRELNLYDV
jgi:hypothetical protein